MFKRVGRCIVSERSITPLYADSVVDCPPAQLPVQFPIIDELADEFALLMADVTQETCSLSRSRRLALKTCMEEKLKAKRIPIVIPSSAEDLMSTMSKYWDFLNFEIAQLFLECLKDEALLMRMRTYEANLRKKSKKLLRYCKKNRITAQPPPGCRYMMITMDVDPHSFSLQLVLDAKDFLAKIGIKATLFSGITTSSIILHFYVLDVDVEPADYQQEEHKVLLKEMHVVAIEVDGVLVYPSMHKLKGVHAPTSSLQAKTSDQVHKNINAVADCLHVESVLVSRLVQIRTSGTNVSQQVVQVLEDINEEIKGHYQVKTALCDLKLVAETAHTFLGKADDMFHYCQGSAMAAAKEGLDCSPPNLRPLCDLINLMRVSLAMVEQQCLELLDAYNRVIESCNAAADVCDNKGREYRNKKGAARGIGGTAAGALMAAGGGAVATGVAASVVAGVFTFGIGTIVGLGLTAATGIGLGAAGTAAGVGTAVATHYIASKYAKIKASFRRIREQFETLLGYATGLREGVAELHTLLEHIAAQIQSMYYSVAQRNVALILDAVNRLNVVCVNSYSITSKCRKAIKTKTEELQAIFRRAY